MVKAVMTRALPIVCVGVALFLLTPVSGIAGQTGEWRAYASDKASTKYTPLDQIDADTVHDLRIAWRQSTIPDATRQGNDLRAPGASQNTPIMAEGRLYISTPLGTVTALDATTGEVVWFDTPPVPEGEERPRGFATRGLGYWSDDDGGDDARVIAVIGSRLVALNAETGERYPDFGIDGEVDLVEGYDDRVVTRFRWRSAPLVVNDIIVVGSAIGDITNATMPAMKEMPPGDVRGFDVRTGEQRWIFHTIAREGEPGNETWLTGLNEDRRSWEYTGNTNMWASPSADEELGYVYLPLSTPTGDYYGGHRPGDNLFAESLVCLDAETGERVWHFQAVHHGLWDYDFPTHPNLIDITVDGRQIKALAQVSKQGFVYVFDRVTGEPVWPIEERPVPQETNMPGEVPSATQPFPTKPAPFDYQGVTIDDLVDFTPEIRAMALEAVEGFRLGPLFTPLDRDIEGVTRGTIMRPPNTGAAGWAGAAVDPDTGMLYVPSFNQPVVMSLYQPDPALGATVAYTHGAPEEQRLARIRARTDRRAQMPLGLPLVKPPYSRMSAIDLNTGEYAWQVPTGNGDRYRQHRLLRELNLPPLGGDGTRTGPVLTKTLLIYCLAAGGTDGGPRLVAYDKTNGEEVGSVNLPSGALGTPMTYMVSGRQYIALGIGGGPRMVAFALPD